MKTACAVRPSWSAPSFGLGLLLGGCAGDPGQATLRVTAYGEAFVEDGIPADILVDGWAIDFDRFLVAIREVEADGEPLEGTFVVDLTHPSSGDGQEIGAITLTAGDHPHLGFRVAPPVAASTPVAATEDDVMQLVEAGASLWVEGRATQGDQTVTFSWAFDTDTRYVECHSTADLADGGDATSQLTFHADHLFYDDLDSPTPNVAFALVATADVDADGDVTAEELRALDITTQARYQVGSRDVTDLWSYIRVQSGTLGHIDGEGHCELGS